MQRSMHANLIDKLINKKIAKFGFISKYFVHINVVTHLCHILIYFKM